MPPEEGRSWALRAAGTLSETFINGRTISRIGSCRQTKLLVSDFLRWIVDKLLLTN